MKVRVCSFCFSFPRTLSLLFPSLRPSLPDRRRETPEQLFMPRGEERDRGKEREREKERKRKEEKRPVQSVLSVQFRIRICHDFEMWEKVRFTFKLQGIAGTKLGTFNRNVKRIQHVFYQSRTKPLAKTDERTAPQEKRERKIAVHAIKNQYGSPSFSFSSSFSSSSSSSSFFVSHMPLPFSSGEKKKGELTGKR